MTKVASENIIWRKEDLIGLFADLADFREENAVMDHFICEAVRGNVANVAMIISAMERFKAEIESFIKAYR